jgi:hypothetical protein
MLVGIDGIKTFGQIAGDNRRGLHRVENREHRPLLHDGFD